MAIKNWLTGDQLNNTGTAAITREDANFSVAVIPTSPPTVSQSISSIASALQGGFYVLYGIMGSAVAAWSLPALTAYFGTKSQRRHLAKYISAINEIYRSSKPNKNECLKRLAEEKQEITSLLAWGKINELQYNILHQKISDYEEQLGGS